MVPGLRDASDPGLEPAKEPTPRGSSDSVVWEPQFLHGLQMTLPTVWQRIAWRRKC